MAWIEVHDELHDHPKTLNLAQLMGWDKDTTVGKLTRLWSWCQKYAADGDLRKFNDAQLAGAMCVDFADADRLKKALVTACWLDREPYFRIHDWWDYSKHYLKMKYQDKPEKWKDVQRLYSGIPEASTVGVTPHVTHNVVESNLTNQPDKPLKLCGTGKDRKEKSEQPGLGLDVKGSKVQSVSTPPMPPKAAEGKSSKITAMAENELMARCRDVLSGDVMNNDGGKWLNRIRHNRRHAEKVERILNEMARMDKEGEAIENRGAYAEHLWKEWAL